eukprot:SAG11_NODE_94_length_17057_cov_255.471754_1_plen_246_part_00
METSTIDHARAVVAAERNAALDRRLQQRLQQEEEDQALARRLQASLEGANRDQHAMIEQASIAPAIAVVDEEEGSLTDQALARRLQQRLQQEEEEDQALARRLQAEAALEGANPDQHAMIEQAAIAIAVVDDEDRNRDGICPCERCGGLGHTTACCPLYSCERDDHPDAVMNLGAVFPVRSAMRVPRCIARHAGYKVRFHTVRVGCGEPSTEPSSGGSGPSGPGRLLPLPRAQLRPRSTAMATQP